MQEYIRRSITIPKELDEIVTAKAKRYSYSAKNDLLVELLELGIIKFDEDISLKKLMFTSLEKMNLLLEKLDK